MTDPTSRLSLSILGLALLLASSACAARALERSEPPTDRVAATPAAALGGRWSNLTRDCVEPDGSTSTIATVYASGDPSLDQFYRDTVAAWRFRPGSRQRCDTVRFDEDFGPESGPLVATWKYEPVTVDDRPACASTETRFNLRLP